MYSILISYFIYNVAISFQWIFSMVLLTDLRTHASDPFAVRRVPGWGRIESPEDGPAHGGQPLQHLGQGRLEMVPVGHVRALLRTLLFNTIATVSKLLTL